jgi:hypothetical protein
MRVKEIILEGMDWIHLACHRDHRPALTNITNKSSGSVKADTFLTV